MTQLVLPAHRPTLADLVGRRRAVALVVAAFAAVALFAAGWTVFGPGEPEVALVRRAPVAFNLRHPEALRAVRPASGELLRLERRRPDGLFLDSFAVSVLSLPPYRGEASGSLPLFAGAEVAELRRRVPGAQVVEEGRVRVNEVPGYSLLFRARLGARTLFGRLVLLPEPFPGARRGVKMLLLGTPAAGVVSAASAGSQGATKLPYRSFRFGTEAP